MFNNQITTLVLAAVLVFTAITLLSLLQLGGGDESVHDFVKNNHFKAPEAEEENSDHHHELSKSDSSAATLEIPQLHKQPHKDAPVVPKQPVPVVPAVPQQPDTSSLEPEKSCPGMQHNPLVSKLFYWKEPTEEDLAYRTPYADAGPAAKYVSFEPDVGGWNNIRMQMELVLVFAYATGRTLVLPPTQQMYLLSASHKKGESWKNIAHSFADFFPFDRINKRRFPVISMEEYMEKEGITGRFINQETSRVEYPPKNRTAFKGTDRDDRRLMWRYVRSVSACPQWHEFKDFVVIPPAPGVNISSRPDVAKSTAIAASGRTVRYYDEYWVQQPHIHFISNTSVNLRLLEHFYTFIHFEDEAMDRYYKRFVRDEVHYIDLIFCKAAIILEALLTEEPRGYSAFHIRRGEFQYKAVKIPADQLIVNVGSLLPAAQPLVFLASDERNQTWFLPFQQRFPGKIRNLDDYMDLAKLRDINPNYLGMIDQVVCSAANGAFVGTWFSTFSGYITRLRGYLGYKDSSVYYGDKEHRDRFQKEEIPAFPFYMREFNVAWDHIDW